MKKTNQRFLATALLLGLLFSTALLAIPKSFASAAGDVTAVASPAEQSGVPGATVSFAVTIANNDVTPISLNFSVASARGITTPSVVGSNPVDVGAGGSVTRIVDVVIPGGTTTGQSDIITFTVTDGVSFLTSTSMTVNVVSAGAAVNRPLVGMNAYSSGSKLPRAGSEFPLTLVLENRGQSSAFNLVVTYEGEGFYPRSTGGVQSIANLEPGGKVTFVQNFLVGDALTWSDTGTIKAVAAYTDGSGKSYTDTFTLTISLTSPNFISATSTPKPSLRPQLVITGNSTDIDPLQPGSIFELTLDVKNLGSADAKDVIMVLGGGAASTNDAGTPQPGVSGSGAELTNFAPLGSSNIVVVGDIAQGASASIKLKLVVNVTTIPGAYTLKTSFSYLDGKGIRTVDDQVITLLVYSLPQVEISFYRDPGYLSAGMMGMLPLQVTNLGKKSSVLGNMVVTSPGAEISNNTSLVGALDPGGYFTLDAEVFPMQEGPLEINVSINYTDDFNQPREVTQTLTLNIEPAPEITPEMNPGEGMPVEPVVETFWSKLGRFFKGLFGLDSGVEKPVTPSEGEFPTDGSPVIVGPKG